MTVEELIGELMATCQSLNDEVRVGDTGEPILLVSSDAHSGIVRLNDYESESHTHRSES